MTAADRVPVAPADPAQLRDAAAALRSTAARVELTTHHALLAWNIVPGSYRAPEADGLHDALLPVRPAAEEIVSGARAACLAIERFADDLDDLQSRRSLLLNRLDTDTPHTVWTGTDGSADAMNALARDAEEREIAREVGALHEAYDDAVDRCARALRAIPDVSWASLSAIGGADLFAPLPSVADTAGLTLLDRLASASDTDISALLARHPEWAGVIRAVAPEEVARWWSHLDPAATSALVAGAPALIGNLDGVAIADRVTANRRRARDYLRELAAERRRIRKREPVGIPSSTPVGQTWLRELDRIDREIAYFTRVRDGQKQLYAWNPEHGALIEMNGDPSTATSALFVVPGTNTRADSFMRDRPVTGFADWQVTAAGSSVVAFTVMTGPMPQIGLDQNPVMDGPQWNRFAEDRGAEYAAFIRGVEAAQPDLWTMSYEHSYGGGVGSAAESHGGTVDARFLAAAVGAVGPYEPHPGTTYFAAQATDDINRYYAGLGAGPLGFTVAPESIPGVHVVDSGIPGPDWPAVVGYGLTGNPFYVPGIVADSVDHHQVLMSDDERVNGPVLDTVRSILKDKGRTT